MNDQVNYYDKYPERSVIKVYNINNTHQIHLSKVSFEHNNKQYNITIGEKGCYGDYYRFIINGKSYVSDNVWLYSSDNTNVINSKIYKIKNNEITKKDILIDNIDFITDKDTLIQHYVKCVDIQQRKELELQQAQDEFWKNAKVLLFLYDDGGCYFAYILQIHQKYHFILAAEPLITYMHAVYESHEHTSSESLYDVICYFIHKLNDSMCSISSPLFVRVGSKSVFETFIRNYTLKRIKQCKLPDHYAKEINVKFEIVFRDDDSDDKW